MCARSEAGDLVAAGARSSPTPDTTEFTGFADPAHRGQGLGTLLLNWATDAAGHAIVVRSESPNAHAVELLASLGFHLVFEEIVMCRSTSLRLADSQFEELETWTERSAAAFYEAYVASFASRAGFPNPPFDRWVQAVAGDDDFVPESSIVVRSAGSLIGLVLVAGAWIDLLGVLPETRCRGIGSQLVRFALASIAAAGADEAWLNVGANNPTAESLYRGLGLEEFGRRRRFGRLD